MKHRTAIPVLLCSVIVFCASAQRNRIIRVPQDRPTIQAAVNASRVGDTVLIDHGVYYENIRIDKNIVLASSFILDDDTSHISRTVIDGSRPKDTNYGTVITIAGKTDTNCIVAGLTIRGGTGTRMAFFSSSPGTLFTGGGIIIMGHGAKIMHNRVVDNHVAVRDTADLVNGGGIRQWYPDLTAELDCYVIIEKNLVQGNTVTGILSTGGGIRLDCNSRIIANTISDNSEYASVRGSGGGIDIILFKADRILIEGNLIIRNFASAGGGIAIHGRVKGGTVDIFNNVVAYNRTTQRGGGLHCQENLSVFIANNTFVFNTGGALGGALSFRGSKAIIVNNIFWNNQPDQIVTLVDHRIAYNLIQNGYAGLGNFSSDPGFLKGDSLFHLSPSSSCLSTGIESLWVFNNFLPLPANDFDSNPRPAPVGSRPDIGAQESPLVAGSSSANVMRQQERTNERSALLSIVLSQTGEEIAEEKGIVKVKRGIITPTITLNGTVQSAADRGRRCEVILPPDDNLFELEIIHVNVPDPYLIKSYPLDRMLMTNFWLKGSDQRMSQISSSAYVRYVNLKPGSYELILNPTDANQYFYPPNAISIAVTVLPPWWQRAWAYALYGFVIASVAFAVYRVRVRRLQLTQELTLKQLQADKLAEVDRMKSRFFANLSHEFRTPLSLILGPADQLETTEKEPPRKEQLTVIRRNAERLLRMVNLLLQFARIESGTLKLQVSLQPIPTLLRRIVSSFSTAAVKKGIALHFDIEPPSFEGYLDTEKVEHIVENLLSNAMKYTNAGGRVDLTARRVEAELTISVSDTGIGIPEEDLARVFDRFYRVDASHRYEGTGIGLSLTKELVDLHRGSIALRSSVGVGTVATVRLPISGFNENEIVQAPQPVELEPRDETEQLHNASVLPRVDHEEKTLVLVVEDNDDARVYLCSRLKPEFDVMEASSGTEAVKRAQDRVPDIVVSDVMMPAMNGYELCKQLKGDERTSHIPVILLTALAGQTDKIEGLQTGADDYLVKPFDARELLVRIRNLIANRKKLQERFRTSVPLKPGEVKAESLDDAFLRKAMTAVENYLGDEQFGIEQFAGEVFLSRSQLHRKLRALTNLSPTEFIRHLRLHRAKELLEKRAGTIAEIADRVGLSNHSYFAKSFKEKFGVLPSEIQNPS